jgi:prolyl-tRNA editing enzyme YbaK/EbsC (Cys-tRNA(Pro) deacylase)
VSVERVRDALAALGVLAEIREFDASTATAMDAAAALGTSVERIVKSLVFAAGDEHILVMASGPNRVDTQALAHLLGKPVKRADPDRVRAETGFSIGGIPPVGHLRPLRSFIDRDLLGHDVVWAAAGTPNTVFSIAPLTLVLATSATVADLKQSSGPS